MLYLPLFFLIILSSNEVPYIVELSGKDIVTYTSPHVGEYKLQDQSITFPNITLIREMRHSTQYSQPK